MNYDLSKWYEHTCWRGKVNEEGIPTGVTTAHCWAAERWHSYREYDLSPSCSGCDPYRERWDWTQERRRGSHQKTMAALRAASPATPPTAPHAVEATDHDGI